MPLRYPWLWLLTGLVLVAAVAVAELIPGPAVPNLGVSDKIEHASAYFVLTLWFAGLYRRHALPLVAVVLFALGFALDLLQLTTKTRFFELYDVLANGCGILAALVLALLFLGGWCQRVERLLWAPAP
ncbi:MAG TPA: VanZ family protein [Gammaproteobacteria bacterium]|nr:VanZ family protein [Gammaproteobacteria bacterium]